MKKLVCGIVLSGLLMTSAFAAKISDLYQAEIPVPAQTEDLKASAIKQGFLNVLIKLSGDNAIDKNPLIKASLNKPDYYVHELNYSPPTTSSSEYLLHIQYEAADINRLLTKASIPYWGEPRPLILMWIASSKGKKATEIISNETQDEIHTLLMQQSKRFGLPLIFPMMDVADVSQVSPEDVLSMSFPVLQEAGKRYAPEALLVGKIQQTKNQYESEWQLILGKFAWQWTLTDKNIDQLVSQTMSEVSTALARHYAVKSLPAAIADSWLNLEIINVTQQDDLSKLMSYLKQVALIREVKLLEVSSDVVELSVLVRGSHEAFKQMLVTDARLSLKYQDPTDRKLVYVWAH